MRRRQQEHEHYSMSTRWPGNRCEPSAERHTRYAKPVRHCFNHVRLRAPGCLRARNASPWLHASFLDFEPPEHVSRTSVRPHTCSAVYTRASCVLRNREHEERPAGGRVKTVYLHKEVHSNTRFPFGMWVTRNLWGVPS